MLKPLILVALLFIVGCATADVPVGETYLWRCDGGVTFTARNTTGGNAEVVAGGRTYRLPGVMAASGVRYFDGRVEYWEHRAPHLPFHFKSVGGCIRRSKAQPSSRSQIDL